MELVGKWKISELCVFSPRGGSVWKKPSALTGEEREEYGQILASRLSFTASGKLETVMPLPKGVSKKELDEAVKGGLVVRGKEAVIESTEWKAEGGKAFCLTKTEGKVLGKKISPWVEIVPVGDAIQVETVRYVRAD